MFQLFFETFKEVDMTSVRWTGAAGLEFTEGEQTILIDPFHSRPGKFDVLITLTQHWRDIIVMSFLCVFPDGSTIQATPVRFWKS
jgi:hypothetical protein